MEARWLFTEINWVFHMLNENQMGFQRAVKNDLKKAVNSGQTWSNMVKTKNRRSNETSGHIKQVVQ